MSINPTEFLSGRPDLMKRYSEAERKTIFEYWEMMRHTRSSGKLAENVIISEFEYWERFDAVAVARALRVHLDTPAYRTRKESYTRGILRNIASNPNIQEKPPNKFHNFDQHPRLSSDEYEEIARKKFLKKYEELQKRKTQSQGI